MNTDFVVDDYLIVTHDEYSNPTHTDCANTTILQIHIVLKLQQFY